MPSNNDDINDNEVLYRRSVVREGVPFVLLLIILLMTIELEAWRASNPFFLSYFHIFCLYLPYSAGCGAHFLQ